MGRGEARPRENRLKLRRRAVAALALATFFLLTAIACESVPSAPGLPQIELPTNSRGASPSPVPAVSQPHATATTLPDVTATIPVPTNGGNAILVVKLEIAEISDDLPPYSRDDWKHWVDADKDCQDTRVEVLIEESEVQPTFKNEERCRVISGLWEGPYTGQSFTEASDLDIDHLVPLKNAHLSGGWQWDDQRREEYANSMATDYHLIAVEKYANRSKGPRGPEEWQPPYAAYHCEYAYTWIGVKAEWGLTATASEWAALEAMLAQCPQRMEIVDGGSIEGFPDGLARLREELGLSGSGGQGPAVLVATFTPEPFTGSLVITEIMPDPSAVRDAAGEWFEIYNPDEERGVELRGWTIRKDGADDHRIVEQVVAPPGGYLVLGRNGDPAANGGIDVGYEYGGISLTNEGDVMQLLDPAGRVVARIEYGEDLVFAGASTSLDPGSLDPGSLDQGSLDTSENDDPANWCRATTAMPNGDFGTPGAANDPCQ